MKRMSEMDGEAPMKRLRHAGDTEIRLLIQSKAAGSIIGKGGSNISRLRSENQASITVPDCPGPERVLSIGGSEDVVLTVLEEVLSCLEETQHTSKGECDIRVLVHQSQAGCIIGKAGSKIKELRELCGGQVKVYTNCCPQSTDRIVQIIGDRKRALITLNTIIDALRDSPVKGVNNAYNPHNFDEFFAQEYGGWGECPKGGRFPPMIRGPPPPMRPGGPPMGRGPMVPGGHLIPPGPPPGPPPFGRRGPFNGPRGPPPMRSPPNDDFKNKPFMNGNGPINGDINNKIVDKVTIPKDVAGAIIGKGGARIRKIRTDSGASISIEDIRPGASDRVITISGSEQQINHAQFLLQQSALGFKKELNLYGGDRNRHGGSMNSGSGGHNNSWRHDRNSSHNVREFGGPSRRY